MMTLRTISATAAVVALAGAAGCSASSQSSKPTTLTPPAASIGATLPPATSPAATPPAALGTPINRGALSMTIAGPATTRADGAGLDVTFAVTMHNTGTAGDVEGPASFGVRCDANRADGPGGWVASTTAARKRLAPGQTLTGTAVVSWLEDNSKTKCSGATTIEAHWAGGAFLAWTIPADQVAKINAA